MFWIYEGATPVMNYDKKRTIILGITLFAMFFGAGNLIFPSFLGFESRANFTPSILGFAITAILLPMLGINVIVKRKGMKNLGDTIAPWFAALFTFLIYITIGPLLAIPRTSSTSFAIAIEPFISNPSKMQLYMVLYSIVFFTLSILIAFKPDKLSSFLGKMSAPLLIVLILIIFIATALKGMGIGGEHISEKYIATPFISGFLDGYQTMDTIAALNFGIIFVFNVEALGFKKFDEQRSITLKSSIIAGSLLFLIYLALGLIGRSSGLAEATNGTQILTYAVQDSFGMVGMIILAVIFVLACFNTCTALISCVSNYFHTILPNISYKTWVVFFGLSSAVISNAGLNAILKFSIPILNAIYPLAISLIVVGLFNMDKKESFRISRKLMMSVVGIFSVGPVLFNLFNAGAVFGALPLYDIGLVWLIPGLVALVVGYLIQKVFLKEN